MFVFISFNAAAQCNTTLNKLLPQAFVNNDDRFGSAIAANEQYLVVAAENSDTTGILYGGAAFVYEKTVAGWAYRAMLTASDPDEYDFFGNSVSIDASGNTIVIINRNYDRGGAYIFEKPVSGWETMHETANIKFPEYLEFNSALDISDDGSTIVVSNPMSPNGLLYLLRKPLGGWTSAMTPEILAMRADKSEIYLGNDVLIQDDYIYASTNNESNPAIYVYKKSGSDYPLIAKLSASVSAGFLAYFGHDLAVHGDMIVATGLSLESNSRAQRYFLFRKMGEWADMYETGNFYLPADLASSRFPYPIEFTSATKMTAGLFVKAGEYYTGKVIEMTTSDGTWQDLSIATLFEEPELSSPPSFGNGMEWNGSDLLMSSVRKPINQTFRNSVLSLTHSAGIWGGLQHITLPRKSSSNVYFGTSIVKTEDAMLAGAPYDGSVGRGAGAVYVYDRVGDDFVKVHTLYPSRRKIRPRGGSDAGFGYSLSVHGDEMAVGAPSFLYADNQYGKIFMYRRSTQDWTSAELYDSLIVPVNLNLNHVGAAVAMNDQVLFASAYNNFADEHTNAVVVFEKIDNKWTYKQLIKMGKPIDKSWPSVKLSLNGNQLAVGQFYTINGGVSIINKDPVSGVWKVTAFISGDVYSGLGSAVKLMDNHLFVGSPGVSYNGVYRAGAVLVFTKLPGDSWHSGMQASALIGAKDPIEGAFFGSSLDVVGNTMVVGAPGMFLTFDSKVRTIPGNTYVIQSEDYYWTKTTQYLNLQGDRYASNERDHFGSCVAVDEEYFYIGARSENTSTGKFSGAVYYIPTPPVIFLEPPVCSDAEPFVLKAYPFDGTWSGPGIDAQGTFDPSLAGTGIFDLTYSTPNCNYQGTVQIEVKAPPAVKQVSPADVIICSEQNTTLALELITGAVYNWYYRPEGADSFAWLAKGAESFVATNPGDYRASVSAGCAAESPVFRIHIENFPVSVGPQPVVCSSGQSISLTASDNSGRWEGRGVSNNRFNATGLGNGTYQLIYRMTTPTGCNISLKDSIRVNAVTPLTVSQSANDFCETGAATLQAKPDDNALTYTWYYSKRPGDPMLPVDQDLLDDNATVYKQGYYQASATNGECSNSSNVVVIGFSSDLTYALIPEENSEVKLCNADDFTIKVTSRGGTIYRWQYKPVDADAYDVLDGETTDQLVARETGFYKVSGEYGFCSFESAPVSLHFTKDEVFVPNVFTVNGDDKNPEFKVATTFPITSFSIFNRHGDIIYSNSSGTWDGGQAPAGVYYWYLRYNGCEEAKELKGWVQVMR